VQLAAAVPVKPAKPVTDINAAAVADFPVNATVMDVAVDLTLFDIVTNASRMAGAATPVKESRAVEPPPAAKVDTMDEPAFAAVLGVASPVTTHDTATLRAMAVVTAMAKLGEL
jgi:hypothetical protein